MKTKTLLVASKNPHKIKEVQDYLKGRAQVQSLLDFLEIPVAPEEGRTYHENALQKAAWYYRHHSIPVLTDDSGLEVEALGGMPGIHSAHFAGPNATDAENRAKLLACMKNIWNRKARFVCVLCFFINPETYFFFEGMVNGYLLLEEKGSGGFGYDPLFVPLGYDQTFAELSLKEKNQISHRARALQKFYEFYTHYEA
jgi:XTP/dITP diphosphohydrolase